MNPELKKMLTELATNDVATLEVKGGSYGDSWKRRGGVGAFMMLARKWDRIENVTKGFGWDVFLAASTDGNDLLDDIADLRCYLLLVESEVRMQLEGDPFAIGALREMAARSPGAAGEHITLSDPLKGDDPESDAELAASLRDSMGL